LCHKESLKISIRGEIDDEKAPRCGAFSLTTGSGSDVPSVFLSANFTTNSATIANELLGSAVAGALAEGAGKSAGRRLRILRQKYGEISRKVRLLADSM